MSRVKDRTRANPSLVHSTRRAAETDRAPEGCGTVSGIGSGAPYGVASYDVTVGGPGGNPVLVPGAPACAAASLGGRSTYCAADDTASPRCEVRRRRQHRG
ncbi:transcriptional regulatory protein [Streptomyces azureus]|uniref:Transcriptional regulatory protein n=1 Tax=Streptomyces azureus TaxID=146537 RepID=A0A0K8PDF1_STRAJ|nr:transcriptional regulatory protein [Streptomyces azureus]